MGAKLIKWVANNTNTYAGDGTTLSTLFANSILEWGLRAIENGFHPVFLKKGIEKGKKELIDILNEMKLPMTWNEYGQWKELLSICWVSSNNDETIAQIVSRSIQITGLHGTVEIEESPTSKTQMEIVDGLMIGRGFASEEFLRK